MYSKTKYILFLTSFLFLFSSNNVNAQVIINEINPSDEWVELYKSTSEPVSLEGCTMYFQDTKSQDKLLTSADNFLEGENYKVIFTEKTVLSNSDPDTVLLECPAFVVGPVTYVNNINSKSYARIPNGIGDFAITSEITLGSQNPNSTPTPIPTQEPTNAPTVSPTKSPSPQPTVKPTPTKTASPKATSTPQENDESEVDIEDGGLSITPLSSPSPEPQVAGATTVNRKPLIAISFIGLGLIFLGYCGYLLYNQKHAKTKINN